jgi:hypothetical protein
MQKTLPPSRNNPLANFMRQPKIYIRLPSDGEFWDPKSLDMPENREFPVFSMTAKDELMFKTPDALMNGQSMVDVIQSCIPNIKNAWNCPTVDLDTILIAIRLATYGETMKLSHKVPVIAEDVEYEIDLRLLLDQQQNNVWIEQVVIRDDLIIFVKPLTYKHLTQTSIKSFETTRIMSMINDDKLSDEQKLKMFNDSFVNLTKITVDLMAEGIYKIIAGDQEVTDTKFIFEFISNTDKDVFEKVQNHLKDLKERNEIKPLVAATSEEQQEQGAPATYTIPVSFNNSDFFG